MTGKHNLHDPYFSQYHDRGIQKWLGFMLSEHTAQITAEKQRLAKVITQKRKMTENEIGQLFEFAFNNNRQVVVQLEMTDTDGNYFEDIVGFINGYDDLGYMISNEKIHYDEIRNVELFDLKKWSDI